MKLQILVPQYNEDESIIKPLLDSIAIQIKVDFSEIGVIIVNDGSDCLLDANFLKSYPFKIDYYEKSHEGVSAARNFALDMATADYVMFCDADDMFYKVNGLWMVMKEINKGFDCLISLFYEEWKHPETGDFYFVEHSADSVFVHGKVHRLKHLIDNNIRWNDSLTIHEDSYFNTLSINLTTDVKYQKNGFYLWRYRENSICRHDPKYMLKTYKNLLDSNDALIDEFIEREKIKEANLYASMMILEAYYNMNKSEWLDQMNLEYRNETERRFKDYFLKHEKCWRDLDEKERMEISERLRARNAKEGMLIESIGLNEWLEHIKTL